MAYISDVITMSAYHKYNWYHRTDFIGGKKGNRIVCIVKFMMYAMYQVHAPGLHLWTETEAISYLVGNQHIV